MDKLKELSVKFEGKIRTQNYYNANVDDTSFRKLTIKDYRHYKIKIDEFKDLYSIGINVYSDLSFSINKPDRIFLYNLPKYFPDLTYTIYVSNTKVNLIQNRYLEQFWKSLTIMLNAVGLSADESLFFYKNYIFFFLVAQRDLASIIDNIIDLINANENIFKREIKRGISIKSIPKKLKPLLPLLKKYSISDDDDREQLILEMDRIEKQKLIKSVEPFFDEIKIYLDSFMDLPLSEEAMMIGELAELVSELKIKNI